MRLDLGAGIFEQLNSHACAEFAIERTCTGLNFADANIFIAAVSILAAFNISKPLDDNGNEFDPVVTFTSGMVTYVIPTIL